MKMGVLGSGMVAQGLSARLAELGHDVTIGTRDAEKLRGWQSSNQKVTIGSFAETAAHGEMLFNATNSAGSLNAYCWPEKKTWPARSWWMLPIRSIFRMAFRHR
jgi:3-hydroxyisobutyrate dehydrogenase-like beta-hydroxyacid dehydrogenase